LLRAANPDARHCYEQAAEARQRAFATSDAMVRDDLLASEARWLKLAQSYEFSERLSEFLNRPVSLPEHPVCRSCGLAMWLIEIQSSGATVNYVYECKVCETKTVLADSKGVTGAN
jgi:hypothetical protein